MHKLFTLLCLVSALVLSSAAKAEIFVATYFANSILVYDNFDAGLGVTPKRQISGPSTRLNVPSSVVVYTGSEPGSETEIFVCNAGSREIAVFPVNADGDVEPSRIIRPATNDCWDLAISQDEIYTGYNSGVIETFSIEDSGDFVQERRTIALPPEVASILGLDVHNGELYALLKIRNVVEEEVWVFDTNANGPAADLINRRVTGDPALTSAWTIDVAGDEIFVGVDSQDLEGLVVYDIDINAASVPIRTLSIPGAQVEGIMVNDKYVYVSDNRLSASIHQYDVRSGGNVQSKRAIVQADAQDPLNNIRDIFVTRNLDSDNPVFGLSLEEPLDGMTHSGVGNLRGWSLATEGIEKIEIYVDGVFYQDAPYGGARADVAGAFPTVSNGLYSGFSLAFNYSALETGEHSITARALSKNGGVRQASSTFEVVRPGQEFIADPTALDLGEAACSIDGQRIILDNMLIEGDEWDAIMKWRPAEQGFEVETYIFNNSQI